VAYLRVRLKLQCDLLVFQMSSTFGSCASALGFFLCHLSNVCDSSCICAGVVSISCLQVAILHFAQELSFSVVESMWQVLPYEPPVWAKSDHITLCGVSPLQAPWTSEAAGASLYRGGSRCQRSGDCGWPKSGPELGITSR
jgi:hypothetical protein